MGLLPLLTLLLLLHTPLLAQTGSPVSSDPQAVAIVQAAITKMGGATAIAPLQSWTIQAQAEGSIDNGTINQVLTLKVPQRPAGGTAPPPERWSRPRSIFIPTLVSSILLQETQDPSFSLGLETSPIPNSTLVVFSLATKTGRTVPAQKWYFDTTTNLPSFIELMVPAKVGLIESFPGRVTLSDYRDIGGVLYPFHVWESLLRPNGSVEMLTLQSLTPSTAALVPGGVR